MSVQGSPGLPGVPGIDGKPGIKGDIGPVGPKGPEGKKGDKGWKGEQGPRGETGAPGPKGRTGTHGLPGADGMNAAVADQFLSKMNQTKIEIQNVQKEVEANKNASESFAKEAQDAKNETKLLYNDVVKLQNMTEIAREKAKEFAGQALQSRRDVEALSNNMKEIFCKMKPADQVCSVSRRKREIKKDYYNLPAASGASKPIPFIFDIVNPYKLENKIQKLEQAVNAEEIVEKFEKILQKLLKIVVYRAQILTQ